MAKKDGTADNKKKKKSTAEKQEMFLEAYRRLGTILRAAETIDVDRRTVQRWRKNNKKFNESLLEIRDDHDDQAYVLIHDAIRDGDVEAAKWLLTRPGHRFHDDRRRLEVSGRVTVAQQRHILILEETGRFLAAQMADPQRRARLLTAQEAFET